MKNVIDSGDIEIKGAGENNLKHVNVTIPKNKLVVFVGISGSGKSSLAFDTIAVESSRQWQASYPLFLRNKMPHYDRPKVTEIKNLTPSIVVDQKAFGSSSRSTVGTAVDVAPLIRLLFSRVGKPSAGGSMAYSFNHPNGMCPECTGFGEKLELMVDTMYDKELTLNEGAIQFSQFSAGWQSHLYQNNPYLDPDKKLKDFSKEEWDLLINGSEEHFYIKIKSNATGRLDHVDYEGIVPRFYRLYINRDITKLKKSLQKEIRSHVKTAPCHVCGGSGLNPTALKSKINGYNIVDYMHMPVSDLANILDDIKDPLGSSLATQIKAYLTRMVDVGIGYLSLERQTDTLSGGENQRIKMVRNLGSSLSDITYIFDEPTAGLHPADAERIGKLLVDLRNQHNNVLVVEHSKQMIALADYIVELGPGAGTEGGKLVYAGDEEGLVKGKSLTAKAMQKKLELNDNPLPWDDAFEIKNAHCHNLKHIDVDIPKGVLTAITGVAGSGKSSLVCDEFTERFPDAIVINQKPIGTSIRSTPATYTGVMDEIRKLFAEENHVAPGMFSFNSIGGCLVCKGRGSLSYDMAFAEPVVVKCEECDGHRYSPEALSYKYKGKNIEDVMKLTIEEAMEFFDNEKIGKRLQRMLDVGLGYLTLGQPTSTLSGGEVQRVKLASELHKEGNVYILDEPSTGLHSKDVEMLHSLLRKLVDNKNTVVIVEHRLDLIARADWIIDMGPEGGTKGGEIVFQGTVKDLVKSKNSKTAKYLKKAIK